MKVFQIPLKDLKPSEYNPRAMTKGEASDLKESIDKFGMVEPIVVNKAPNRKNIIIGGHQRYFLLKRMGKATIPAVYVNIPKLKDEQELNLRLNKNLGHWDWGMLANFDEEILNMVGFDNFDIENIFLKDDPDFQSKRENWYKGMGKPDGIPERIGYYGGSFWKDIKRIEAKSWSHLLPIPPNKLKKSSRQQIRYSRTNPVEIERIITTYMRKGDYFLESCCGWSTFGTIAKFFGYSGVGIDIWETAINFSRKQTKAMPGRGKLEIKEMDALDLKFKDNSFDFVYCNPPFFNLEGYKMSKDDLSVNKSYREWTEKMVGLSDECYRVLRPDCLAVFTMNDFRQAGTLVDAHSDWAEIAKKVGFRFWDLVVAEVISQNLAQRKKAIDLKRTIKCHEYILVFKKPKDEEK